MKRPRLLMLMIVMVFAAFGVGVLYAQSYAPMVAEGVKPLTVENASQIDTFAALPWEVRDVSVSPDGTLIAVSGNYNAAAYGITIYDYATGERVSSMPGRMESFRDLVWSPDSQKIAVVGGRDTPGAEVWSVHIYTVALGANPYHYVTGDGDAWYHDEVESSDAPGNPVLVAWNPASDMVAVAFNRRLDIYDVTSDEALFSRPTEGVQRLEWSSDGGLITTRNSDRTVTLWGVPNPQG